MEAPALERGARHMGLNLSRCGVCGERRDCPLIGWWWDDLTLAQVPGGRLVTIEPKQRCAYLCGVSCARRFMRGGGRRVESLRKADAWAAWITKELAAAKNAPLRRMAA